MRLQAFTRFSERKTDRSKITSQTEGRKFLISIKKCGKSGSAKTVQKKTKKKKIGGKQVTATTTTAAIIKRASQLQ